MTTRLPRHSEGTPRSAAGASSGQEGECVRLHAGAVALVDAKVLEGVAHAQLPAGAGPKGSRARF